MGFHEHIDDSRFDHHGGGSGPEKAKSRASEIAPGKVTRTARHYVGVRAPRAVHVARDSVSGEVAPNAGKAVARAQGGAGGRALPSDLERSLSAALGTDLSSVQVHTGAASNDAAAAVSANAFAQGQDIHFAAGTYDPHSTAGQRLIAHEVAHTVQQRGAVTVTQGDINVSSPGDAHEVEAESFAQSFIRGDAAAVTPVSRASVARQVVSRDSETTETTETTDTTSSEGTQGEEADDDSAAQTTYTLPKFFGFAQSPTIAVGKGETSFGWDEDVIVAKGGSIDLSTGLAIKSGPQVPFFGVGFAAGVELGLDIGLAMSDLIASDLKATLSGDDDSLSLTGKIKTTTSGSGEFSVGVFAEAGIKGLLQAKVGMEGTATAAFGELPAEASFDLKVKQGDTSFDAALEVGPTELDVGVGLEAYAELYVLELLKKLFKNKKKSEPGPWASKRWQIAEKQWQLETPAISAALGAGGDDAGFSLSLSNNDATKVLTVDEQPTWDDAELENYRAAKASAVQESEAALFVDEYAGDEAVAQAEVEALEAEAAEAAEPEAAEPEAAEPVAVEPELVEPVAVEPEATETVAVEPETAETTPAEPEATEDTDQTNEDGDASLEQPATDEAEFVPLTTIEVAETRAALEDIGTSYDINSVGKDRINQVKSGDMAANIFYCSSFSIWTLSAGGYEEAINDPIKADKPGTTGGVYIYEHKDVFGADPEKMKQDTVTGYMLVNQQAEALEMMHKVLTGEGTAPADTGQKVTLELTGHATDGLHGDTAEEDSDAIKIGQQFELMQIGFEVPDLVHQKPGDFAQMWRYTEGTTDYDGAGHAWQVHTIKVMGDAMFGLDHSPTLTGGGAADGQLTNVEYEITADTDPRLCGPHTLLGAKRIEANIAGAAKTDLEGSAAGGDGGVTVSDYWEPGQHLDKQTGVNEHIGRLNDSPWAAWKWEAPSGSGETAIGNETADEGECPVEESPMDSEPQTSDVPLESDTPDAGLDETPPQSDPEWYEQNVQGQHTVQAGDTLGTISKAFYGDPSHYGAIAAFNQLADPNDISKGQLLLIPYLEVQGEVAPATVEKTEVADANLDEAVVNDDPLDDAALDRQVVAPADRTDWWGTWGKALEQGVDSMTAAFGYLTEMVTGADDAEPSSETETGADTEPGETPDGELPAAVIESFADLQAAAETTMHGFYKWVVTSVGNGEFDDSPNQINLLGIRGWLARTTVDNIKNEYNDTIIAIWTDEAGTKRVEEFKGSVDPGNFESTKSHGQTNVVDGQYGYVTGKHNDSYEALRPDGSKMQIWGDRDGDGIAEEGDSYFDTTQSGCNIHAAGSGTQVNDWSHGCQVIHGGKDAKGNLTPLWFSFMDIVNTDVDKKFKYTLIDGSKIFDALEATGGGLPLDTSKTPGTGNQAAPAIPGPDPDVSAAADELGTTIKNQEP